MCLGLQIYSSELMEKWAGREIIFISVARPLEIPGAKWPWEECRRWTPLSVTHEIWERRPLAEHCFPPSHTLSSDPVGGSLSKVFASRLGVWVSVLFRKTCWTSTWIYHLKSLQEAKRGVCWGVVWGDFHTCHSLICSWENHVRTFIFFRNSSSVHSHMCACHI